MSTAREEAERRYPATYRYDGDDIPDRESGSRRQAFIAGAAWAEQNLLDRRQSGYADAHPERIVGEWNATWRPEPSTEATREALIDAAMAVSPAPFNTWRSRMHAALAKFNVTLKGVQHD